MKKKQRIITIAGLLLVAIVGATFAYYTSNTSFENVFNAGKYKVTLTEVFESPDNWVPGETVPKTVTAKNEGTVPVAVRISYTEQWIKEIDGVETDITTQVSPNPAIINFDNQDDWTLSNGYYYYKYILEPTDETSSFISGVTLDSNLDSVTCTGEGNEKICEAQNPVSGAKYKLTFTIQTVQADKYQDIWDTEVEINKKILNPYLTTFDGNYTYYVSSVDPLASSPTEYDFDYEDYQAPTNNNQCSSGYAYYEGDDDYSSGCYHINYYICDNGDYNDEVGMCLYCQNGDYDDETRKCKTTDWNGFEIQDVSNKNVYVRNDGTKYEMCGVFGSGQEGTVCLTSSYYISDYGEDNRFYADFEDVSGETGEITTISELEATGLKGYVLAKTKEMLSNGASCYVGRDGASCSLSSDLYCSFNNSYDDGAYCDNGLESGYVYNSGSYSIYNYN